MHYKDIFSLMAIILAIIALYPYIKAIINKKISPHFFSWIIWGIATFTVFFAQLSDGGGVGAYALGFAGLISILIAFLSYKYRVDITINKIDWLFLISAIFAIFLWWVTSSPLLSVIILSTVDFLGFLPTFRRVYDNPNSESIQFYFITSVRNLFILIALENYTLITILFPFVVSIMSFLLVLFIIFCKKSMKKYNKH